MSQYDSQFEENLYQLRREKLAQIAAIARAANPSLSESEAKYPNAFRFTHTLPELRAIGDHLSAEDLATMHIEAAIAGRIMAIRVQGKAGFAQLQQGGQRIQLYVRKDDVGASPEQSEALFKLYKLLDLGDHIGVRGYLMRTRTGELTLHAAPVVLPGDEATPAGRITPITFLSKAMLTLPDKYHGLEDVELRYRRRYLDLFTDTGDTPEQPTSDATSQPSSTQNPVILSAAEALPHRDVSSQSSSTQNPVILSGAEALLHRASAESKDPENANTVTTSNPFSTTPPAPPIAALNRLPAREVFVKRAAILRSIRHFFDTRGYLEVETPMLHTIAGGAAARPFKTHHNALDIPLSLRIAPELYLKRLVVGGLDRVYEINRNFRNEGVSTQHNPEFTMLEFYQAYANYHDLMDLTKELITFVAQEVNGTTTTNFNGTEIDLSKWTKLSMREAIDKWWPKRAVPPPSNEAFKNIGLFQAAMHRASDAYQAQIQEPYSQENKPIWSRMYAFSQMVGEATQAISNVPTSGDDYAKAYVEYQSQLVRILGKHIATTFELLAEEHLIQPTIIYDFPLAVSPLSKVKPNEPDWVERFEFYIGGFEVGNAFSELNDPDDQRNRFLDQLKERDRGDDEAHAMDEDYVRALGYGLPPTAGEGIGIDRLTMILTGSRSIRDVILFPLMRPHAQPTPGDDPTSGDPA